MNKITRTFDATVPRPHSFARFYATLADIARERTREERERDRLIVEVGDEIMREQPPPTPLRPGCEIVRSHAYLDETGAVLQ